MLVYDAQQWEPSSSTLKSPDGGSMIYLANRLLREETDADKIEFVRGLAGLDKDAGKKKVIAGIVAGYLISKALRKNG